MNTEFIQRGTLYLLLVLAGVCIGHLTAFYTFKLVTVSCDEKVMYAVMDVASREVELLPIPEGFVQ